MSYAMEYPIAARAGESARAAFVRRTYAHLAGAILAFVAIDFVLLYFFKDVSEDIIRAMFGSPISWAICLGLFMVTGWVANYWARSEVSRGLQYAGLALYVVTEAIIFVPLLYIAAYLVKDQT